MIEGQGEDDITQKKSIWREQKATHCTLGNGFHEGQAEEEAVIKPNGKVCGATFFSASWTNGGGSRFLSCSAWKELHFDWEQKEDQGSYKRF